MSSRCGLSAPGRFRRNSHPQVLGLESGRFDLFLLCSFACPPHPLEEKNKFVLNSKLDKAGLNGVVLALGDSTIPAFRQRAIFTTDRADDWPLEPDGQTVLTGQMEL